MKIMHDTLHDNAALEADIGRNGSAKEMSRTAFPRKKKNENTSSGSPETGSTTCQGAVSEIARRFLITRNGIKEALRGSGAGGSRAECP